MAGQDMVKQAEIRGFITQINEFRTAINTFKIKYDAMPGDMGSATQY